ncbi:glycosyltransferase family 2 protein [Algoriphagus namhaensis]
MAEISVIIPTYKRPGFLKSSIQSVFEQSFRDFEVIVVDDNGKDTEAQKETAKEILPFQHYTNFGYIVHDQNRGGSAARNTGWQKAKGEYLCFLDNDDFFYPKKLEIQLSWMKSAGSVVSVCGFDSYKEGKKVRSSPLLKESEVSLLHFLTGQVNFASGSTLMIKKTLFDSLEGFDETFRRKQDVELMVRILQATQLGIVPHHLVGLNIDDRANVPPVDDFLKLQKSFQAKFAGLLENFSPSEQNQIREYDLVEFAKVCLWNKDVKGFLKVISKPELPVQKKLWLLQDLSRKFVTYYLK